MSDSKEVIQARLLSNIDSTYDKTEGSFFYDAEKPVAIELENVYLEQSKILPKAFAETAIDTDLDRIVEEQGLKRKVATNATTPVTIIGSIGSLINIGDKVSSDTVNFSFTENKVIDATGEATVNVQCELSGTIGNVPANTIKYFPVTLPGLISVTNPAAVTNGYNKESNTDLRKRYYTKVQTPSTSGNKYHYINWAKEVVGVGDAKVFPLWNGNGTVKVIIIDSNRHGANIQLVTDVADHIEENRPIGANVTVVSATEKAINISATVVLSNGMSLNTVSENFQTIISDYLASIAFSQTYVSYAKIGGLLLATNGIMDYSILTINGATVNVTIADTEVAILGTLNLGV